MTEPSDSHVEVEFISYIFSEYPGNDISSFNFLRLYNPDDFACHKCPS